MLTTTNIIVVLVVALVVVQMYVSIRLCISHEFTVLQKLFQLLIIWLVPIFGAMLIRSFMEGDNAQTTQRDKAFTPDGGVNPPGIGGPD